MIKHIFSYFLIGLVCLFSVSAEAQTYKFKPLDYPGAIRTAALGIDAGNIVGWYYDANGSAHGFLYDGTNWTPLDYPGAISSEAIGIDADAGIIIGAYTNEIFGSSHGFLYDGNTWTTLDYPDAWETIPAGIDDGIIVGTYVDASYNQHGFLATPVIVIGGCNTGVEDKLLDTGYKMSDLIAQCATNATNHGKFVTCVDGLTSSWKKMRLITGKEQDAIQSCAAKADIP